MRKRNGTERAIFEPEDFDTGRFGQTLDDAALLSELFLTSSTLFQRHFLLNLKLSVDRRTLLWQANFNLCATHEGDQIHSQSSRNTSREQVSSGPGLNVER